MHAEVVVRPSRHLVGLGLWTLAGKRRALLARTSAVLVLLLGVGLPAVVTWLAFARRGAGTQFIYDNFILNAHWQWHSGRHLLKVVTTSGPILLLCLVGARFALARRSRVEKLLSGDVVFLCTLAGLIAGLAVVPAAYEQYTFRSGHRLPVRGTGPVVLLDCAGTAKPGPVGGWSTRRSSC